MNKKYGLYILVIGLVFCFVAFAKAEQGLAGWWKFDEGSGDILHDSSGKNNHGKIQGAKWVKVEGRSALSFHRNGNYVSCGNDVSLQSDGPLTISMWLSTSSVSQQGHNYIVSKHGWHLGLGNGNSIFFESRDAYNDRYEIIRGRSIPTNIWVYIAIVYSIKNQEMVFYIDGEKDVSCARTDGGIGATDVYFLVFGKESPAARRIATFDGLLSEIKIYNKDLTAEEIKRNYQQEKKD